MVGHHVLVRVFSFTHLIRGFGHARGYYADSCPDIRRFFTGGFTVKLNGEKPWRITQFGYPLVG